ncbi:MAG TPA: glycosyl hydrolase family 28-related protein [Thermoanaerobaculia bacterium]|nr:glycosyl hydrolase family 28-related protein [Thermoanaerobaculia bacterium]
MNTRKIALALILLALAPFALGQTFNVRSYSAWGDNTHDDTDAFKATWNAAIANFGNGDDCTAGARRSTIYIPTGVYKISDALPPLTAGIRVYGDGVDETVIDFRPSTADSALITFQPTTTNTTVNFVQLDNLSITGCSGTTKTAVRSIGTAWDSSIHHLRVQLYHTGDTALEIQGWDTTSVSDCFLQATYPIHVKTVSVGGGTGAGQFDHFTFNNMLLYSYDNTQPLIKVDSGVTMSNVSFTGHQTWVGGTDGIYCATTGAVNNVIFEDVRWENGEGQGATPLHGYMFYLVPATASARLTFLNCSGGSPGAQGFYLRNINQIALINTFFGGTDQAGLVEWDADNSCDNISFTNAGFSNSANTVKNWGSSLKPIFAAPAIVTAASQQYPWAYYKKPNAAGVDYDMARVYDAPVWKTTIASLASGSSVTLPTPPNVESTAMLRVSVWAQHATHADATLAWGDFRTFFFGAALANGYLTANSDTAGRLCLLYSGGTMTLKNNLGVPVTVRIVIE